VEQYDLKKKNLCESGRSNLNTMIIALKLVVSCETLGFNHAFSKTCQNAKNGLKS